jgi:hypothetical protein
MEGIVLEYKDHLAECGICQETMHLNDIYLTGCKHQYCMACFSRLLQESQIRCPLCRQDIETYTFRKKKSRIYTLPRHAPAPRPVRDPEIPGLLARPERPEGAERPEERDLYISHRLCVEVAIAVLSIGHVIWWILFRAMQRRYEICEARN